MRAFIYFFLLIVLSAFVSSELSEESSVYYEVVQDDPALNVTYSVVNGSLEFEIEVGNDNNFGIYTSDESKNTGKVKKNHEKHGNVKPIKDKNELIKNQKNKIKYKPKKQQHKIFIGEGTEIIEVANETKVIYTETNGLQYNVSLRRCESQNINCSIQPHDITIIDGDAPHYKFGAYDSETGSGSSWYQYRLISNQPLKQISKYRFGVFYPMEGAYYIIDFSGSSAYNLDSNNETHDFFSHEFINSKSLTVSFFSNGTIDPDITQELISDNTVLTAEYTNTRNSFLDGSIALNQSTTGYAYITEEVSYGRLVNVTNVSTVSYPDFSVHSSTLGLWRLEEGTLNAQDEAFNYTLTNNGAVWETDTLPGAYSLNFDGVNDYAMHDDNGALEGNSITVGAWVKIESEPTSFVHIVGIRKPAGINGYLFGIPGADTTRMRVFITNDCSGWTQMDSNDPYTINQWYFIAFTATSGSQRYYIDGVQQTATGSTSGNVCYSNGGNFSIGGAQDGTQATNLSIGNLFVLNEALTASQIRNIYNATKINYIDSLATHSVQLYNSSDNSTYSECSLNDCVGNYTEVNISYTSVNNYVSDYVYNITYTYENVTVESGGGPDLTDPVISGVLPNGSNHDNDTIVMINATVTDDVLVETVNVTITLSNGSTHFAAMTVLSGSIYHYNYTIPNVPLGRYNFTILAADNASNEASITSWFNVTNSTVPSTPNNTTITVTLSSPANGSTVTSLTPTLSFVYTHGEGVVGNCTIFVNNTESGDATCTSGATTEIVVNNTLANLTTYNWFVRARAGANETNSTTFNFNTNTSTTSIEETSTSSSSDTVAVIIAVVAFIAVLLILGFKLSDQHQIIKSILLMIAVLMSFAMINFSNALVQSISLSTAVQNSYVIIYRLALWSIYLFFAYTFVYFLYAVLNYYKENLAK